MGVALDSVRVHDDSQAHDAARNFSARAFAYGNHIFLGQGEKPTDLHLMAHEAAHVVQQRSVPAIQFSASGQSDRYESEADRAASAVAQGERFTVTGRVDVPRVQRSVIGRVLDKIASWAYNIPGFRLLTIIIGVNPINMESVDRSAANILRGLVELMPGGHLIEEALDKYGVFDKLGGWLEQQVKRMASIGSAIKKDWNDFVDDLSWTDIRHPGKVIDDALGVFKRAVQRVASFAADVARDIIKFIKDAILMPLAKLAEGTRAWDLLIAVLGKNPITGEPVPRTAETLIGGFMKLIGQEEIWENIQKAKAIPRAWAWFQGALKGLLTFVAEIPSLFIDALKSLTLEDILILPKAFIKVGKVFIGFVGNFISWAGEQVWTLLQIIFEVVAPSVMPYLKKVAAAFRTILKNPGAFVGNLVKAAKQGFLQFGSNFLNHLKAALIGWLTGTLEGANIYIPQSFAFMEIIRFVLSVLGLTWQNIRVKLVKAIGETAVKALETGFDIVVTLVTQGPAAAWQKIQEGITNLKEIIMDGIMNFVKDRIVTAAVTKLISMLNPAGAFIQAIIATYNTIMFFVERLKQIAQVVAAFIDSVSAIANGIIAAAANKVESTLGGLLTLVISFLARLVGLGKVSDAVKDIIAKIRAPIDKALDSVVEWIVTMAKKAGKFILGAVTGRDDKPMDTDTKRRWEGGMTAVRNLAKSQGGNADPKVIGPQLATIKGQYGFKELKLVKVGQKVRVHAFMNPEEDVDVGTNDFNVEEFTGESLWIEVARRIHAEELPVGVGTRISASSLQFNSRVLLDLVDKSSVADPLKNEARGAVASNLMRASLSRDEREIYRLVGAACRAVNQLYAAEIATTPERQLQAHHRPGVRESSPTFAETRAGRKRASVARRIRDNVANLTPQEQAIADRPAAQRPALIREYVQQILEAEIERKTEQGIAPLEEFDLDVLTSGFHLGTIHARR